MKLSDIQETIFDRVDDAVLNARVCPVAIPHEKLQFNKDSETHWAEIFIVPNDVTDSWCGTSKTGNILFNVHARKGSSLILALVEAEKFIDELSEGLNVNGVSIPDEGSIKKEVIDEKTQAYFVPVVIFYEA